MAEMDKLYYEKETRRSLQVSASAEQAPCSESTSTITVQTWMNNGNNYQHSKNFPQILNWKLRSSPTGIGHLGSKLSNHRNLVHALYATLGSSCFNLPGPVKIGIGRVAGHRCIPQWPASSPADRSLSTLLAPVEGRGSPAEWGQSSGWSPPALWRSHRWETGIWPQRSFGETGCDPHQCCRQDTERRTVQMRHWCFFQFSKLFPS